MGAKLSRRASSTRNSISRRLSKIGASRPGSVKQCRANKSRLRSVRKLLSVRDRKAIQVSWEHLGSRGPSVQERLLLQTWLRASAYSPEWVWAELAGVEEGEAVSAAGANPRFRHIVRQVTAFLNTLIVDRDLDLDYLKSACAQLGRRHYSYFRFSVSMVEGMEAALLWEVEDDPSMEAEDEAWRTLYAWQKFIRVIIDQMRVAYLDEKTRMEALPPPPEPNEDGVGEEQSQRRSSLAPLEIKSPASPYGGSPRGSIAGRMNSPAATAASLALRLSHQSLNSSQHSRTSSHSSTVSKSERRGLYPPDIHIDN